MKQALYFTLLLTTTLSTVVVAQSTTIFPKGEVSKTDNHVGTVWLNELSEPDSTFKYSIAMATFAAGSYLDWHTHPAGQILLFTGWDWLLSRAGQAPSNRA